jgi:hypothetical protein
MALAYNAERHGRQTAPVNAGAARQAASRAGRARLPNTISASQARAARRREALSNEQAVAAWLRELANRPR